MNFFWNFLIIYPIALISCISFGKKNVLTLKFFSPRLRKYCTFFLAQFFFSSIHLHYFPIKQTKALQIYFYFIFCWITPPGRVGHLSSGYSYIFKTRELHKGGDAYKILLNCPFCHRPKSLYLQNVGKPSFLAKIMLTIISMESPSYELIILFFLYFFYRIFSHFSLNNTKVTWSYKCLMSLPLQKYFISYKKKFLKSINKSILKSQPLIQSINQYIPVCFYVCSINIKCILTFPFHIHSRSNLVGDQCRHLMLMQYNVVFA